jgi:lipopolysaccharide transport system permease protein
LPNNGLICSGTAQAPNLILSQPNLVKKVVFPLEILPFVAVGSGLFHLMLSLSVLLVGALLERFAMDGAVATTGVAAACRCYWVSVGFLLRLGFLFAILRRL